MLAEVVDAKVFYSNDRSARKPRLEATVTDRRGYLTLTFFGQSRLISYWQSALQPGTRGIFAGKVREFNRKLQLAHPDFVTLDDRGPGRRRCPAQRRPGPGCGEPADRAVPVDRQAADLDRRGVRRAGAGHPHRHRGPAAGLAPGRRRCGRPGDRVPVRPPTAGLRTGGARPRAAALRRGLRAPADHGLPSRRCRLPSGRAAPAADRRAAGRLRCPAAVHPDRGPGRGQRADLRRAVPDLPDAAPAAGRGRLGQDPGRAAGHAGGGRRRRAGGAAGAHRGARRPALLDRDPPAGRPRGGRHPRGGGERDRGGAGHRLPVDRPAPAGDPAGGIGRGRDRHRHPCAAQRRGAVRRPGPGRGRRAAPVRGRAAGRAERQGDDPSACAGDDRDPDPAVGGDDRLR